jgi:hypothetical protein
MAQTQVRNVVKPLSADEISEATSILKRGQLLPNRYRVSAISLR